MKACGEVAVQLHSFNSTLNGEEWSASHHERLPAWESAPGAH